MPQLQGEERTAFLETLAEAIKLEGVTTNELAGVGVLNYKEFNTDHRDSLEKIAKAEGLKLTVLRDLDARLGETTYAEKDGKWVASYEQDGKQVEIPVMDLLNDRFPEFVPALTLLPRKTDGEPDLDKQSDKLDQDGDNIAASYAADRYGHNSKAA